MTIEVHQMVIKSELNSPANPAEDEAENCCDQDENASAQHRAQRAALRLLRSQLEQLRER